jgi:hypothetical protein
MCLDMSDLILYHQLLEHRVRVPSFSHVGRETPALIWFGKRKPCIVYVIAQGAARRSIQRKSKKLAQAQWYDKNNPSFPFHQKNAMLHIRPGSCDMLLSGVYRAKFIQLRTPLSRRARLQQIEKLANFIFL